MAAFADNIQWSKGEKERNSAKSFFLILSNTRRMPVTELSVTFPPFCTADPGFSSADFAEQLALQTKAENPH
ncbi:jg18923 [Pararge aegeria aegeria]|uniref:Jg18923 protein n=1 Tax=Pararge aegeria aegeria TaxID=348720 RepID=A0A8S4SDS4_9NEOP|nr:jg18923 [Pararge aegeria aegeria]